MDNGMDISVWNIERCQNGMKNFKNGMEDNLPYLFHTRFCVLHLQKNTYRCWVVIINIVTEVFKGGESSSQFRWFTIAKIELYFLIFFALILGLRLQRYSTNTKRCPPEKSFWKL